MADKDPTSELPAQAEPASMAKPPGKRGVGATLQRLIGSFYVKDADVRDLSVHWVYLALCLVMLTLPFLMSTAPSERVSLFGFNLPASCPSREIFHTPCPGCGLTRSFVLLAHGRIAESLALHRLGLAMALFFLYQVGYRIYCLAKRGRNIPAPLLRFQTVVGLGMVAALLLNWLIGLPLGGN